MLYKTDHKETQKKTENEPIAIEKNDLLKATMSQRHSYYHGFVTTRGIPGLPNHEGRYFFSHFSRILLILDAILASTGF